MAFHVEDISLKYAAIPRQTWETCSPHATFRRYRIKKVTVGIEKITRRLLWWPPIKLKFLRAALVVANARANDDVRVSHVSVAWCLRAILQFLAFEWKIKCNFF